MDESPELRADWRGSKESHKAAQAYIDCKASYRKWFFIGAGCMAMGMFALVAVLAIVGVMV